MHEAGIMKNALEIVEQAAVEHGITQITEIKLVIGKKRVVLPEAMEMAFAAFTKDSELFKGCLLNIETREILLRCKDCGNQFNAELSVMRCSSCRSGNTELLEGNELFVDYFQSGGDTE